MTVTASVSARLSATQKGSLSFKAAGIESGYPSTWFVIAFKRSGGAPTTIADLTDHMPVRFFDTDRGTFSWGLADTGSATGVLQNMVPASHYPLALAGDHVYFCVVATGDQNPPINTDSFVFLKSLGTLRA